MTDRREFLKAMGAAALTVGVSSNNSFAQAKSEFSQISRIPLTRLPTSCERLNNLTQALGGPDIYIKRDDVMDIAAGGNKTRKLEYALAQALERDAKAVVTQGGLQSNHVRQTVSAANKLGLESHVVLSNPVPEMKDQLMSSGNYLMDQLMGAEIYYAEEGRGPVVEKVLADLSDAGKQPYNIPAGASNGIGSLGYVNAARELVEQWNGMGIQPSHIFTASGSCGTQAGLVLGLRYFGNTETKVVGISVSSPADALKTRVREVVNMIEAESGISGSLVSDEDIIVFDQFYGDGYGRPSEAGVAAIKQVAEQEGILLDPVYTGKCMSAMMALIQENQIDNPRDLVFLHTGGSPALHPYAEYLDV